MVEYNENIKIYHRSDPSNPYLEVKSATYSGKWMGEGSVTFDVESPQPIRFAIGDYLYFRGHRFELNYEPSPKQTSSGGTAVSGFTYSGVKFNDLSDELTRCDFLDTVLYDNHIHYYGLPNFSFYCETPQQLCERIKANLDRIYTGEKEWTVELSPTAIIKEHYDHVIKVDNITCMQALELANKQWDLNFVIYDRTIKVGFNGRDVNGLFKYGRNKRLTSFQKSSDSNQKIVTRLHAYGNDKNLPHLYYQSKEYRRFSVKAHLDDKEYPGYVVNRQISCYGLDFGDALDNLRAYICFDVQWSRMGAISGYFVDKVTGSIVRMTLYQIFTIKEHHLGDVPAYARISISEGFNRNENNRWYNNFLVYYARIDGRDEELSPEDFLDVFERNVGENGRVDIKFEGYYTNYELPFESREFENEELVVPSGIALNNLMLPGFPEKSLREMYPEEDRVVLSDDPFDPWIMSHEADKIGIREGTTFFNSDGNDNHDVYPTLEDMTADMLRAAGYDIVLDAPDDNGKLDEVLRAENPEDDGDTIVTDENKIKKNFVVYLKDIGFDMTAYSDGNTNIIFNTGMCSGREFAVNSCVKVGNQYRVVLTRKKDGNLYFPNNNFKIQKGDKFVITGIYMPRIYVEAAAAKLYAYAVEWLLENDHSYNTYTPEVDNIWAAEDFEANGDNSVYANIMPGDIIKFKSDELGVDYSQNGVNIDTLSIKVGEAEVAKLSVTLKDKPTVSTLKKMQQQITNLKYVIGGGFVSSNSNVNEAQVNSLIEAYIGNLDIAYLQEDNVFTGTNTFGDVFFTNIKTRDFVSGMLGSGGAIYTDANGTHIEADYMTIRKRLEVLELQIQKMSHIGGQIILSAADCVIDHVTRVTSTVLGMSLFYRCYFRNKDNDGNEITNDWVVGDQARCQTFNLESYDGKVGNKYYWRKVLGVGSEGEFHYIDLYGEDIPQAIINWDPNGKAIPSSGDKMVLFGSQSGDATREKAIIEAGAGTASPYHRQYVGIKTFKLSDANLRIDLNPSDAKLKVSSMEITSTDGRNVNVEDAFSDKFEMYTENIGESPKDENGDIIEKIGPEYFDISRGWTYSEQENHEGDYLVTDDGIAYRFEKDDSDDKFYWVTKTDKFLVDATNRANKALKFTSGFRSEGGFASMFSGIEYFDEDGKPHKKEGYAGTFVEASEDGWITGFKVEADVMKVKTKNFTLTESGDATFSGFIKKKRCVITWDNRYDYMEFVGDSYYSILWDKVGSWIKIGDGTDAREWIEVVIDIPSAKDKTISQLNAYEEAVSMVGNEIILENAGDDSIRLRGVFLNKNTGVVSETLTIEHLCSLQFSCRLVTTKRTNATPLMSVIWEYEY